MDLFIFRNVIDGHARAFEGSGGKRHFVMILFVSLTRLSVRPYVPPSKLIGVQCGIIDLERFSPSGAAADCGAAGRGAFSIKAALQKRKDEAGTRGLRFQKLTTGLLRNASRSKGREGRDYFNRELLKCRSTTTWKF